MLWLNVLTCCSCIFHCCWIKLLVGGWIGWWHRIVIWQGSGCLLLSLSNLPYCSGANSWACSTLNIIALPNHLLFMLKPALRRMIIHSFLPVFVAWWVLFSISLVCSWWLLAFLPFLCSLLLYLDTIYQGPSTQGQMSHPDLFAPTPRTWHSSPISTPSSPSHRATCGYSAASPANFVARFTQHC